MGFALIGGVNGSGVLQLGGEGFRVGSRGAGPCGALVGEESASWERLD